MGGNFRRAGRVRGYIIWSAICGILGAVLIFIRRGYGFLGLCLLAAAAVVLAYLGIKILSRCREKLASVLKTVLTCFIAIGLTTTAITEFFIIRAAVAEPAAADYAIVLGAGVNGDVPSRSLKARLEAALDYAEKYPDAVLILSGGQGSGENITEAECMYNWLTDSGLPGERLILEENASNTAENIQFSRNEILARDPDFDGTVCIITECYHVLRAQLTAQKQGLQNLTAAPAYTGLPILTVNYYLRETPAVWYYLLK